MIKLIRDKKTGDYYTEDGKYQIEKGYIGWNVNEKDAADIMTQISYLHKMLDVCTTVPRTTP